MKLEEFIELPKEEQEKIFGEATRKAIAETHAAGRPSCHGDNKGRLIIFFEIAVNEKDRYF